MFGALLWVAYGVLINASPVIVANVLVFSAAAWTAFARRNAASRGAAPLSPAPAPVGATYQRRHQGEQDG